MADLFFPPFGCLEFLSVPGGVTLLIADPQLLYFVFAHFPPFFFSLMVLCFPTTPHVGTVFFVFCEIDSASCYLWAPSFFTSPF